MSPLTPPIADIEADLDSIRAALGSGDIALGLLGRLR